MKTLVAIFNRTPVFPTLFLLAAVALFAYGGCGPRESGQGGIGGQVFDVNGNVISGALVFSSSHPEGYALTDDKGFYQILNLPTGLHTIVSRKKFYVDDKKTVTVSNENFSGNVGFRLTPSSANAEISNILVRDITPHSAVIQYTTNFPAIGQIDYGETLAFDQISEKSPTFQTVTTIPLKNLKGSTRYQFRIRVTDENEKTRSSSPNSFLTLETTLPPYPANVRMLPPPSLNALRIQWDKVSHSNLKGYRVFRRSEGVESWSTIFDLTIENQYIDLNLEAGTRHEYVVASVSKDDTTSSSTVPVRGLVHGQISGPVSWLKARSPYLLTGDITIGKNGVLEIEKGCEIHLASDTLATGGLNPERIQWVIFGTLRAEGTASEPIRFRSVPKLGMAAGRSDWGGLQFLGSNAQQSRLKFVELESFSPWGITVDNVPFDLSNCRLTHGEGGLFIRNSNSLVNYSTKIYGNTFNDLTGIGVQLEKLFEADIRDCRFMGSFVPIMGESLTSVRLYSNLFKTVNRTASFTADFLEATGNIFEAPESLGLAIKGWDTVIVGNTFNARSGLSLYKHRSVTVENNIFVSLSRGGDLGVGYAPSGTVASVPVIIFNDIFNFNTRVIGVTEGGGNINYKPEFIGGDPFNYDFPNTSPLSQLGKRNDRLGARNL